MEVKLKLSDKEVKEILVHYFMSRKDVCEPIVTHLGNGCFQVEYEDYDIEEGHL